MVYLVGAGPGDPELLTLKGRRVLGQADAVFYDELANPALLDWAPPGAERCFVGKRAGRQAMPQEAIAAGLIARARRGLTVVRLKGGDPMIFGRGGEEIEALEQAGVAWEVVPGVSAGTGVAAAAGLALTRRGCAPGVRLVAGHQALGAPPPPGAETVVVFMAAARLAAAAADLLAQGWPPATPAVVIERGTLPGERRIARRLDRIAAAAERARIQSPALLMVGEALGDRAHRARTARLRHRPPGLILMAHGSPLAGWQQGIERLASELAAPGQFTHAAFLPPVRPSLADAVAQAVQQSLRRLVVVPYFLAPGLHVARDLPELVADERRRHPTLHIELAACLAGHPALRTAVLARAAEAMNPPAPTRTPPSSPSAPGRA